MPRERSKNGSNYRRGRTRRFLCWLPRRHAPSEPRVRFTTEPPALRSFTDSCADPKASNERRPSSPIHSSRAQVKRFKHAGAELKDRCYDRSNSAGSRTQRYAGAVTHNAAFPTTIRRRAASQFRLQDGCHVSLANQSNLLLQQHSEIVNLTATLNLGNPSQRIEWSLVQSRKAPDNPTMVAASMR